MYILIYFVILYFSCVQCDKEEITSVVSVTQNCCEVQYVNDTKIEWKYQIDQTIYYYSIPLCIDKNGQYITRICSDGHFIDGVPPSCNSLQMTDYSCLEGLELRYGKSGVYCYKKSEELMNFDDKFNCPYKNVDATDTTKHYLDLSELFQLWLPFHRHDPPDEGIGYFIPNGFHGTVYSPTEVASTYDEIMDDKCLSAFAGDLSGNCRQKRYHACVYRAIFLDRKKEYKAGKLEADFCLAKFGKESQCRISWTKGIISCICPMPVGECSLPAAYPTGVNSCGLGVVYNASGTLIWQATNEPVQKTFWSVKKLKTVHDYSYYVVDSDSGWTTQSSISCVMCEIKFTPEENAIRLNINPTQQPSLTYSNPDRVFNALDPSHTKNNYCIKCFMESAGVYVDLDHLSFPGLWQCEVIDIQDTSRKILSNVVQVDFDKYIYIIQMASAMNSKAISLLSPTLDKIFRNNWSFNIIHWMRTKNYQEDWLEVIYRFDIKLKNDEEYISMFKLMNKFLSNPLLAKLRAQAYNLNYCSELSVTQRDHVITWPETLVGDESKTNCFNSYGEPIGLKCKESFTIGARFEDVPECYSFVGNTTEILTELENSEGPADQILSNLTSVLNDNPYFSLEDFNKTANIIEKFRERKDIATEVISVISSVMNKNPRKLHESQVAVNVTDRVLYSLDVALKSKTLIWNMEQNIAKENLESWIFDVNSKYSGAAYLNSKEFQLLAKNLTIEEVLAMKNLNSAVFINRFKAKNGVVSITMFKSPVLFNANMDLDDYQPFQRVFGVLLPENTTDIQVVIIFPHYEEFNCAYWMYGDKKFGSWEEENDIYVFNNFTICVFNHATHYGQLIMLRTPLDPLSDMILSTMTAIECGMSTFGMCVILLTAVVFPTWRRKKERLIHYCLVLLLQTILLFVNTNVKLESTCCIFSGALLHFSVLTQFCWMVVIAVHQHRTLIVVYQTKPTFWESRWVMLFTYGVPFLVVVVALAFDIDDYSVGLHLGLTVCYPAGDVLLYGLLLPATAIAMLNLGLFLRMVYKLTCASKNFSSSGSAAAVVVGLSGCWLRRNLDRVKTLALLVFTLGITWWLGFFAFVLDNDVLLYLFSISTGLQGFLIFLVNIVTKKEIWAMYTRKYKMWILYR